MQFATTRFSNHMLPMQQPQRLEMSDDEAARLPETALRAQGHHVQEDLPGGGVRDERHASR